MRILRIAMVLFVIGALNSCASMEDSGSKEGMERPSPMRRTPGGY